MIPADPSAGEAVGRGLPTAGPKMDDGRFVTDSRGIAEFGSTDAGGLDAGDAVKRGGAPEASISDEGTAACIESEFVGIGLETAGVGLGTVDIVLGTVDIGLGAVGVGLVEGAADTTGTCRGTSTEA